MSENILGELPLGLGMALAQHPEAMQVFAQMDKAEQQQLIDRTHTVNSKQEMNELVMGLTHTGMQ